MPKISRSLKQTALALTGFSTPVFGVSWNPPKDKREIVRGVVTFLEDRRVLYQELHREITLHVVRSVFEIRKELTEILKSCHEDAHLMEPLRAMRAACRKFLDQTGPQARQNRYFDPVSFSMIALGEFRGVFGIHLARLCVAFGIDAEPQLEALFPVPDTDKAVRKPKR